MRPCTGPALREQLLSEIADIDLAGEAEVRCHLVARAAPPSRLIAPCPQQCGADVRKQPCAAAPAGPFFILWLGTELRFGFEDNWCVCAAHSALG